MQQSRFEDVVIKEVLKSEFKGKIPAYIINLPHLCTYVQTDNSDLVFEGEKVIAVLFARTMLNNDDVLVVTLYTDTGAPNTITLSILEDKSIEECITDFLDKALPDDTDIPDDAKNERILVMRKLINLVIWFSKKEPEIIPHQKDPEVNTYNFKVIEKNKRLFEANSYKTYTLGGITANLFNKVYDELKKAKGGQTTRSGGVTPHLRSAHWQLYWLGKRRLDERGKQVGESWEVVLHGIQLIGGIPKNKV